MEKPIRKSQSFIYTLFLILGMMLSAIFASYVIYNEGLSNRFAENAKPYLSFQYNFENESPYPNCWRDQGPFSADSYFPKMCVPETNKPLVFLIGDSHAGCLYKGLVHESDGQFEIAPLMQSSCPPLFFEHNNSCSKSQKETYELILKRQPEIVILFAWWGYGAHTPQATDGLYLDILKSIKKLKEAGVRNIIILGPAPNWEGSSQNRYEASLPHNMAELVTKRQLPSAPRYTNYKLRNDQKQMDTLLSEKLSNIPSVSYFSVYDALCSSAGCMTSTTGDASDLTSFDYGHLTISAAKFVARKLIDNSPLRHLKY